MWRAGLIGFTITAASLAPGSAGATVVQTGDFFGELNVEARSGERNDISITGTRKGDITTVRVREGGEAPLMAGDGCAEDGAAVTCDVEGLYIIFVAVNDENDKVDASEFVRAQITANLADGDDTLIGPPAELCAAGGMGKDRVILNSSTKGCTIDTGGGDDHIRGSPGRDNLFGGAGEDVIKADDGKDNVGGDGGPDRLDTGGGDDSITTGHGADEASGGEGSDSFLGDGGDDVLKGNAGRDVYTGYFGRPDGNDELRGGTGRDLLSLLCRTCRVVLDGQPNDGHPGEKDNAGVEDVNLESSFFDDDEGVLITYGTGEDQIIGDNRRNTLAGRRGADEIVGRGGRDELLGGTGDDDIDALDGVLDEIDCGNGDDHLVADGFDIFRDCETVAVS